MANGVVKMICTNRRTSFFDLDEEIIKLEKLLPISDLISIPFDHDENFDHSDIRNRTLQILVETPILELENKDKFSAWWDLAQDAEEGTTLYFMTDYPNLKLLKIFLEPIHRIMKSLLEVNFSFKMVNHSTTM